MKKIRYSFNMVEIMLAIVIIAVGMSSVFVLFPTGLNAHKTAVAENSIADLAEYIVSAVRADIEVENTTPAADDTSANAEKTLDGTKFKNRLDDFKSRSASENAAKVTPDPDNLSNWDPVRNYNSKNSSSDKSDVSILKNSDGIYYIRQLSGPEDDRFVDFSAIARIYKDEEDWLDHEFFISFVRSGNNLSTDYKKGIKKINVDSSDETVETEVVYEKFIMPLVLEISYPADAEYEQREKRYFRFEIFNESYGPKQ